MIYPAPATIVAFAARWLASGRPLHILINNAGFPAPAGMVRDTRGHEVQSDDELGYIRSIIVEAGRRLRGRGIITSAEAARRYVIDGEPFFLRGHDQIDGEVVAHLAEAIDGKETSRRAVPPRMAIIGSARWRSSDTRSASSPTSTPPRVSRWQWPSASPAATSAPGS